MKTPALLSAALLLLLVSVVPTTGLHEAGTKPSEHNKNPSSKGSDQIDITVLVTSTVTSTPNKTYSTYVVYRGILLGGLRRLQYSTTDFTFTYTEDPNFGPFLQSVNGLAANNEEGTYWELLVKKTNNRIIRPNVGIGCYIPSAYDQIILNYNKYYVTAGTEHQNGIFGFILDRFQSAKIYLYLMFTKK